MSRVSSLLIYSFEGVRYKFCELAYDGFIFICRIVLFLSSKSPKQQSFLFIFSKNFSLKSEFLNIQIRNDVHPLFYQCMMNTFSLLLVY